MSHKKVMMADDAEEFVDADAGDSEEPGGESMPPQEDPARVLTEAATLAASVSGGGGEEEDGASEYADADEVASQPRRLIYLDGVPRSIPKSFVALALGPGRGCPPWR